MKRTPVMKFRVVSDEGTIDIRNTIPENCSFHKILHAETEYTEGKFGAFCTQSLHIADATIGWLNFDLIKSVLIGPETIKGMVAACFTLKGNVDCDLQGVGDVKLKHSNYTFYYIPPKSNNKAFFKPGNYEMVYISIQKKYTAPFIHQYPEFKDLYERTFKNAEIGLVLSDLSIGTEEFEILRTIQQHNLEASHLKLFVESKINELLLIYFKKLKAGIESNTISNPNKTAMEKVAHHIEKNLATFFTNKVLSQMVATNVNTLVIEFKRYYKMSPSQYAVKLKMDHAAWRLTTTSCSIADIAVDVGYDNANYFSTAFKKYHRCSPTDHRKNRGSFDSNSNKMKTRRLIF